MDERIRDDVKEPGGQPAPTVNERPASKMRQLAVTTVIAAAVLAVMYGVATHRAEVKDEQRQTEIQRDANTPPTQPSPGASKPGG